MQAASDGKGVAKGRTRDRGRVLGRRREKRIAIAYQAAVDGIRTRLQAGDKPRPDAFFDLPDSSGNDGPAEEILEGVLLAAAEWENRKVPYIGRVFAGLAFERSLSVAESAHVLRLLESMTYRQFILIALVKAIQDDDRYRSRLASIEVAPDEAAGPLRPSVLTELDDLASKHFVGTRRNDGTIGFPDPTFEHIADVGSLRRVPFSVLLLTKSGEMLYRLMGLDDLPATDLEQALLAIAGHA